jgi:hypothetical protein
VASQTGKWNERRSEFAFVYKGYSTIVEHMFVTAESIAEKRRMIDALEADWLKDLAEYARSGDWQTAGYFNVASALRHTVRIDQGVAQGYVNLARKLDALPLVAAAFAEGDISLRHAQVIANAATAERVGTISEVEDKLLDIAREHTPKDLSGVVRSLTDAIDGDGGAEADAEAYEANALYMSSTLGGRWDIKGTCDRLTGEVIVAALNARMACDRQKHDARRAPGRRMDALFEICRRPLDAGELGESHGVRPHVTLVADVDDLPGATSDLLVEVRGDLRRNGHLSATVLDLLLCDCDVSRVITAGKSEVLDVGRATRTVTAAQWKALVVRDRHCRAPGCHRPPETCQAHHIQHWTRGGPTNLENLQLLCWHHHRHRHIHDAQAHAA